MSVCNLFRAISSPDEQSIFYTFSEYTNDLANAIDDSTEVTPTSFICLNIKQDRIEEGIEGFLQNYYENLQCCERDDSFNADNNTSYKGYLLGGLLGALKNGVTGYHEEDGGYLDDNIVCKEDIDIISTDTKDGMKYHEIICYLNPQSSRKKEIDFNFEDLISVSNEDSYLKGYKDSTRSGVSDAWTGETVFYKHDLKERDPNSKSQFTFNAIIVLYKYGNIDDIPLGIYITKQPITKYVSNSAIYGQGTSYALRICMRFASTVDSAAQVPSTTEDITSSIVRDVELIDRMSDAIDRIETMTEKFNEYFNKTQQLIQAYNELGSIMSVNWIEFGSPLSKIKIQ